MKRSAIRIISPKKQAELREERKLAELLYEKQSGLCSDCGCALRWGSAKHEIVFRSHGGSPTDESNCILLCLRCHSSRHGIKIVED